MQDSNVKKILHPVKVGDEVRVESYSARLTNDEEQLLITREGNLYLTRGDGTYFSFKFNNVYDKTEIDSIVENLSLKDVEYLKEKLKELENKHINDKNEIDNSILNISGQIGNMEELNELIKEVDLVKTINKLYEQVKDIVPKIKPSINELGKYSTLRSFSSHAKFKPVPNKVTGSIE